MWRLDVPKILHTYYGGSKLIYMRFLTIKTFLKFNPDWKVVFWHPKKAYTGRSWGTELDNNNWNIIKCKDYMPELMKLPIVSMIVDFDAVNIWQGMPEVHKNDYIRINALHLYGGVWSDMDIIYFAPITKLKINVIENKEKNVYVCIHPNCSGHSTGFNMATPESRFFNILVNNLIKEYRQRGYQCWGPDMFNKYFRTMASIPEGINLDMDVVYAHDCHHVDELLNGSHKRFTDGSIGCHWYGGNMIWKDFLNETKGGEINLTNNIISKLIRDDK